jgi:uncharacterized membrane protein
MLKNILTTIDLINQTIAEHIVAMVSTMWCTYAFTVLVVLPLFNDSWTTIVMFISSSLLQLVLLPVIMVGQKRQGDIAEARAQEDHEAIIDMHNELKEIIQTLANK